MKTRLLIARPAWTALAVLWAAASVFGGDEKDPKESFARFDVACITAENKVLVMEVYADGVGTQIEIPGIPEGDPDRLIVAPEQRRLAFLFRDMEDFKHYLYVHDLTTGETRKLVQLQLKSPCYPAFSPDGNFLAYVDGGKEPGKHLLMAVSFDGKVKREVNEGVKIWDGPVFADRGTLLFGTVLDQEYKQRLESHTIFSKRSKILLESNTAPEELVKKRSKPNFHPSSVDTWTRGGRVLWLDWGDKDPTIIQVRQTTTRGGKSRWLTEMKKNVVAARYSPDGKWIAYMVEGEKLGTDDIYAMRSTGQEQKKLVTINKQPYRGWMFSWALDSKHIAYVHNPYKKPGSMREIFAIRVEGGKPTRLTYNQVCESYPAMMKGKP
ncbi:MAG: hypothetical protein ACYTHN_13075 [Planctomycetota bacterium]